VHLLSLLFKAYGTLDSYTLFRRSKLSFSVFTESVNNLVQNQLVNEIDNSLSLSRAGKEFVLNNNFMLSTVKKPWRQVPDSFIGSKLRLEELYIPSISALDKKTFS
jgi:hypothetical protein